MNDGPSLRERKRLAMMRHVQDVAIALFEEHGFGKVTIEQVAQAAEVSPSSVYRHFGTKEQLVLWDEYDPVLIERLAQFLVDHPPVQAMREMLRTVGHPLLGPNEDQVRATVRWWVEEPSVEAAASAHVTATTEAIAQVIAVAYEREPDELQVRVIAGALVSAVESALRTWHRRGFEPRLLDLIDDALAVCEGGLRLR
ncbi:MAG: TetR/AcrR family transcriptional regulator [Acidimicrobiales bacterium]